MVSFHVTEKGDWWVNRNNLEKMGYFPNWDLQNELIPYFTVDGNIVDCYDGAVFEGPQLDTLIMQLDIAITDIKTKPKEWPISEERLQVYWDDVKSDSLAPLQPREQSIAVLERAVELAKQARKSNEKLHFVGD